MAKDKTNAADEAQAGAENAADQEQGAPAKPTIAEAMESTGADARTVVAQTALDRQLNNNPTPHPKRQFRVLCRVDNEQRSQVFETEDENTAWAMFCDSLKLPESKRSRKFMRPQIQDLSESA